MASVVAGVAGALDALDDLPLVVFGHSKGAVVGWELCRERHEATIDSWLVT